MAQIITTWNKRRDIPQSAMGLWASVDGTDTASILYDATPLSSITLNAGAAVPVIQPGVVQGKPVLYFDGSKDAMTASTTVPLKHIFLVVAAEGNTFDAARGLLGYGSQSILTGQNATSKFANNSIANFSYKKGDVACTNTDLQAPMASGFQVIEMVLPVALSAPLLLGKFGGVGFKGWFAEVLGYTEKLDYHKRITIYRYFSEKYWIWRELADGKKIFPFANNHASPFKAVPFIIRSEPLPSGRFKENRKDNLRQSFSFNFTGRRQTEVQAVRQFEREHLGIKPYAIEDNSFHVPHRFNVRQIGETEYQPADALGNWSYSFPAHQIDQTEVEVDMDTAMSSQPSPAPILDTVTSTALAAYGLRKLRGAYTGDALRLKKGATSDEQDFGFNANGDLDVAAITTWLGGNIGFVKMLYDQSVSGIHLGVTSSNLPILNLSGAKPELQLADTVMTSLNSTPSHIPLQHPKLFAVIKHSGNSTDTMLAYFPDVNTQIRAMAASGFIMYQGSVIGVDVPGNTLQQRTFFFQPGATERAWKNGTEILNSGSPLGSAGNAGLINTRIVLGIDGAATYGWDGGSLEWILFENCSDPDRIALENDQKTYFGIP